MQLAGHRVAHLEPPAGPATQDIKTEHQADVQRSEHTNAVLPMTPFIGSARSDRPDQSTDSDPSHASFQDHAQHIAPLCTDGEANANLAGALIDYARENTLNPDWTGRGCFAAITRERCTVNDVDASPEAAPAIARLGNRARTRTLTGH